MLKPILTQDKISKVSENAISHASSLGIGIGLAFLGEYLATKKRESSTARAISRILGADVDSINRDFILKKLKDKQYFEKVRVTVLNVTKTASIAEFSKLLGENYSLSEAWEIYREIKDIVLDAEIFTISTEISNIQSTNKEIVYEFQNLRSILEKKFEELQKNLEENFNKDLIDLHLLECGFKLVTSLMKYRKGNPDCWKTAIFTDADIINGYDARRPLTDDILHSIRDNQGTIVYGKPYYGKSIILKRVMFEEIQEDGYAVVYAKDSIKDNRANIDLLVKLLGRVLKNHPKLLVIGDNVHKSGSEILFQAFNEFVSRGDPNYDIRFLFGARKEEFDIAFGTNEEEQFVTPEDINTNWITKMDVRNALKNINPITIDFKKDDAILYLQKAINIEDSQTSLSSSHIREATQLYYNSKGDPFMFVFSLMDYLSEGKSQTHIDFIQNDIKKKLKSFQHDNEIWKTALVYSFMDMFGISMQITSQKNVIKCCHINEAYVEHLSYSDDNSGDTPFLIRNEERYTTRHEQWALYFLTFIYSERFNLFIHSFFKRQGFKPDQVIRIEQIIREDIKQLIPCILKNIDIYNHLSMLNRCTSLYNEYEESRRICNLLVENYVASDIMNSKEKAEVYCFGLGNFYSSIKNYRKCLEWCEKADQLDPNNPSILAKKGYTLMKLNLHSQAIEPNYKALKLDPNNPRKLNNLAYALAKLNRCDEALPLIERCLTIKSYYPAAYHTKGFIYHQKGKYNNAEENYRKAEENYRKALDLEKDAVYWYYLGKLYYDLGKYSDSILYFNNALELNQNYSRALNDKDKSLKKLTEK